MKPMPQSDEQYIRDLVATWMQATIAGDIDRIRPLMSEDVVFLPETQDLVVKSGKVDLSRNRAARPLGNIRPTQ